MLFIHIGFHKTGTSTIQYFCTANLDRLTRLGIHYPRSGRIKGGHGHTNLAGQLRRSALFRPRFGGAREIADEFSASNAKHLLLSAEAFHILPPETIQELKEALPPMPAKIIAYVRDLASMTVSSYAQNAKTGHYTGDFDNYFSSRFRPEVPYRGFRELENWADVFGWPAMHVRELNPEHLDGGDLLTDFVQALGIDWPALGEGVERGPRNVTPGWKAVELIRAVQAQAGTLEGLKEVEGYPAIRRSAHCIFRAGEAIAERQGLNSERGQYLTADQREACDRAYAEFVDRLNKVIVGPPIPPPLARAIEPRPFLPDSTRVPVEERAAFFEEMSYSLAQALRAFTSPPSPDDPPEIAPEKAEMRAERKRARQAKRQAEKAAKRQDRPKGRSISADTSTAPK
jgi:hypothetical protein